MKERLDRADRNILKLLQEDGRITNADLARKVGLSPPSMLQRVRKLEMRGYIKSYTTKLNQDALGFHITVFAMVSLSMHQDKPIDQFVEAVSAMPEVMECHHVSGDYDFLLKIIAKDMHDYERIVRDQLASIKSLAKIHSCFVLRSNKESEVLPV